MLPSPYLDYPVCAGSIQFKVASITSYATGLKHPFKSPLHLIATIGDAPNSRNEITLHLPDGFSIGYVPKHVDTCLLDVLHHKPGKYKSQPAGGWKPNTPINKATTPLITCYVNTIDEDNAIQFIVTALIFIKQYEKSSLITKMQKYHLTIEQPSYYNPADHHHVPLIDITAATTPDWTSAFPDTHLLSDAEASYLAAIPCGEDLEPVEPSEIITTNLKPHQKQGLAFLLDRENPTSESYKSLWFCTSKGPFNRWTHRLCGEEFISTTDHPAPISPCASILADDMGLGKTLQTISLIATTLDTARQFENSQPALSDLSTTEDPRPSHTTLLICPVGLLDTWDEELEKHTLKGALKVMRWHGANRHKVPMKEWVSADIIMTTPTTLKFDVKKGGRGRLPFTTMWYRVVFDEAQWVFLLSVDLLRIQLIINYGQCNPERNMCTPGCNIFEGSQSALSHRYSASQQDWRPPHAFQIFAHQAIPARFSMVPPNCPACSLW
jgi:hypothetical protein